MRVPILEGLIRRRILVNFRVDPAVLQPLLPAPFRPKLHAGRAIAGVCLIRLEKIRPRGWPAFVGISSENAAHRTAVEWDEAGTVREGVFIPRRDTGSLLNHYAGGRLFPGEHHYADFEVRESGGLLRLRMRSSDRKILVELRGSETNALPTSSCFASVEEASRFFENGQLGFSVTADPCRLDGLRLTTFGWQVRPLNVEIARSSLFADRRTFPEGSVQFDHALIMRDLRHEWHSEGTMEIRPVKRVASNVGAA